MAYIIRQDYAYKLGKTDVKVLDEDRKVLIDFLDNTPAYPGAATRMSWHSGSPILSEVMPRRLRLLRGKKMYDFLSLQGAGFMVSSRFKDAVEELDPGRHQFFPVTVEDKNGAVVPGEFFLFNIVGRIDSIIEERSNLEPVGRGLIDNWGYTPKVGPWRCALDERVIDRRAGWVEERYGGRWFISDRLADLLRARKMTGFSLDEHCNEITLVTSTVQTQYFAL
jgi:hypothetical protein